MPEPLRITFLYCLDIDKSQSSGTLTSTSPSNAFALASIFSLAHPYGTPTVLSSYSFSNGDAGPPNGGSGNCNQGSGYICQHRWQEIAGMVGFRNTVGTAPMTNWVAPASQRIAFGRGESRCTLGGGMQPLTLGMQVLSVSSLSIMKTRRGPRRLRRPCLTGRTATWSRVRCQMGSAAEPRE